MNSPGSRTLGQKDPDRGGVPRTGELADTLGQNADIVELLTIGREGGEDDRLPMRLFASATGVPAMARGARSAGTYLGGRSQYIRPRWVVP